MVGAGSERVDAQKRTGKSFRTTWRMHGQEISSLVSQGIVSQGGRATGERKISVTTRRCGRGICRVSSRRDPRPNPADEKGADGVSSGDVNEVTMRTPRA